MVFLKLLLFGAHLLVSAALVVLVVSQTTRHEGLGSVGGDSSSSGFRGRPGAEEQLSRWTAYIAAAFMALSVLVFIAVEKFKW
ncbi:MAG: preprotein translocase subunit SecG [Armatimonadetes bacterium]|nr:preprotein translocase subunit SecG [Armatimonadota bacterium]